MTNPRYLTINEGYDQFLEESRRQIASQGVPVPTLAPDPALDSGSVAEREGGGSGDQPQDTLGGQEGVAAPAVHGDQAGFRTFAGEIGSEPGELLVIRHLHADDDGIVCPEPSYSFEHDTTEQVSQDEPRDNVGPSREDIMVRSILHADLEDEHADSVPGDERV